MASLRSLVAGATVVCLVGFLVGGGARAAIALFTDRETTSTSFTTASSFCTAPGPETVGSSRDAEVRQGNPGTNYGGLATFSTRSSALVLVQSNIRSVVAFSLPAIPTGCTLSSAKLRLNASHATGGRTIEAFRAAASWTETGVTWNNQPEATGSGATATSSTGWMEWTVTPQVQAMYQGTNNGFVLRDSAEGALLEATVQWSSKEAASNDPELVLTFG